MEVYEIKCDQRITNAALLSRFDTFDDAREAAKKLCIEHKCSVRVVRVIGTFSIGPTWSLNGQGVSVNPEQGDKRAGI